MQDFSSHFIGLNLVPVSSCSLLHFWVQHPHLKTHSTNSASLALHFVVIHYAWIYTTKWKKRFIAFLWIAFFFLLLQMASANDARYGQKESADQNFDYMFKILIIGNSSVGKTSFLFRYADDSFTPAFVSTVGIDFKVKTIYRNDKRIKLQIWVSFLSVSFFLSASVLCFRVRSVLLKEPTRHFHSNLCIFQDTAGQERYRTITTAYYRGAMGFILMYDITNEDSFNAVQDWYESAYFCLWLIKLTHLQRCDLVSVKAQTVLRACAIYFNNQVRCGMIPATSHLSTLNMTLSHRSKIGTKWDHHIF